MYMLMVAFILAQTCRLWAPDSFWTQLDFKIFANKIVVKLHICNSGFVLEWFIWDLNKGLRLGALNKGLRLGAVVPVRACGSNG